MLKEKERHDNITREEIEKNSLTKHFLSFIQTKLYQNYFPKPFDLISFVAATKLLIFDSSHSSSSCAFTASCPHDGSSIAFTDLTDHSFVFAPFVIAEN